MSELIRLLFTVGPLFVCGPGCVSDEEFARLGARYSPNYPPEITRVADPHSHCKQLGVRVSHSGPDITQERPIYGCADPMGVIKPATCSVFVGHDAPDWLIRHELLHCRYGAYHN